MYPISIHTGKAWVGLASIFQISKQVDTKKRFRILEDEGENAKALEPHTPSLDSGHSNVLTDLGTGTDPMPLCSE